MECALYISLTDVLIGTSDWDGIWWNVTLPYGIAILVTPSLVRAVSFHAPLMPVGNSYIACNLYPEKAKAGIECFIFLAPTITSRANGLNHVRDPRHHRYDRFLYITYHIGYPVDIIYKNCWHNPMNCSLRFGHFISNDIILKSFWSNLSYTTK